MLRFKPTCRAALILALIAGPALAQHPGRERPYDGIQAGVDAFRLAEEKRQAAVADQLDLNDQMRLWNGIPSSRGATIYYGYLSPAAAVAYGYAPAGFGGWTAFEPWPYSVGRVWGYPYLYQPARQPIGQEQIQTGPNRWESHPVYDPPSTPYQPLPPVHSPLLEGTPFAEPHAVLPHAEFIPPPPPQGAPPLAAPPAPATPAAPRRGPREY